MKTIIKVIITTIVLLTLPISIYYGLRLKDTPFTYEYMNRSYVITLPNKVWFEINGSTDILKNDEILVNETPEVVEEGYDIGPQYPKYTTTYENDTIKKVQTSKRVGDTLTIESYIEIAEGEHDEYIQKVFFSQHGTFKDNSYTQEGCNVKISSKNGTLSYDEEYALLMITYDVRGITKVEDTLSFEISCL